MASFASSATTGGARNSNSTSWDHPKWVKSNARRRREKEEEREKANENNGQLHLQPPPWVAHASHLDRKKERKAVLTMASCAWKRIMIGTC